MSQDATRMSDYHAGSKTTGLTGPPHGVQAIRDSLLYQTEPAFLGRVVVATPRARRLRWGARA